MCGRFALKEVPKRFAEYFDLTGDFDLSPSWNIAPSSRICSITADEEGSRHLQKMRWGLIPSWAKDATIGSKLTNARGETIAEKPAFIQSSLQEPPLHHSRLWILRMESRKEYLKLNSHDLTAKEKVRALKEEFEMLATSAGYVD